MLFLVVYQKFVLGVKLQFRFDTCSRSEYLFIRFDFQFIFLTYPNAADKYDPRTDCVWDKIPSVSSATSNSVSNIFSELPLLRSFKHLTSDDLRIILNANKCYQNFPFTFARATIKSQKDPRIFKPTTKTAIPTPSKTSSLWRKVPNCLI